MHTAHHHHHLLLLLSLVVHTTTSQTIPTPLCNADSLVSMSPTELHSELNPHICRPPQVPLDVQNYTPAPAGLQLEQVHIYIRHGERSPVGVRLSDPPANIPAHWNLCKTAERFRASVADLTGPQLQPKTQNGWSRKLVERRDGTVVSGECLLGELTDVGRQSTYQYGVALRKLYVDKLGFIPDVLVNPHSVYFRSTNMPRTMESLQQIIYGLYPNDKCHEQAYPPLLIRNGKDENLIGNTYSCKRLEILQFGFAKAAADAYNPLLERLDKKVSRYLNGNPIRVDGRPRASGVMDTIRASIAHGIKVPPEFEDPSIVDLIELAVVQEWFAGYKTEEVRRLAMGRLLDDLSNKMTRKVEKGEKDPMKILVHSTHDTALAGLCSTLDVFDNKWPAFTASITFELFKKHSTPEGQQGQVQGILSRLGTKMPPVEHYVRMRYQNKDMVLPMCAEKGKHLEGAPEFCTFRAFRDRMRELIPDDWEAECVPTGRS